MLLYWTALHSEVSLIIWSSVINIQVSLYIFDNIHKNRVSVSVCVWLHDSEEDLSADDTLSYQVFKSWNHNIKGSCNFCTLTLTFLGIHSLSFGQCLHKCVSAPNLLKPKSKLFTFFFFSRRRYVIENNILCKSQLFLSSWKGNCVLQSLRLIHQGWHHFTLKLLYNWCIFWSDLTFQDRKKLRLVTMVVSCSSNRFFPESLL